jgi:hypothetical protein
LPEKLGAKLPGATIAFFHGTDVLGSQVASEPGSPQRAELAAALPPVLANAKFQAGERSDVIALQGGGRAVFAPITGSASVAGVGYAVARPRKLLSSPEQLFQQASQDEVKALPLIPLAGAAIGLALIGLMFLYLERDRHLKALLKKTTEIGAGQRDRLIITEWRGAYRKLADKINQAIDKEVEKAGLSAPSQRKKANLDEILGPTPEAGDVPFFGFASDDGGKAPSPPAPAPPPAKASPAPRAPAAPAPPQAAALPPVPAAARPAPAIASTAIPSLTPEPSGDNGASFDENAHWHEVYDQYVATRKQCGEPTDNLTFDKFGVTLKKTRDQIVEKHGAKAVRFTVQIKEGKASLKAQPVKR